MLRKRIDPQSGVIRAIKIIMLTVLLDQCMAGRGWPMAYGLLDYPYCR